MERVVENGIFVKIPTMTYRIVISSYWLVYLQVPVRSVVSHLEDVDLNTLKRRMVTNQVKLNEQASNHLTTDGMVGGWQYH